mmetsp:Transcript_115988/g.334939  ORF Transcript_115988/g.334939 Transcript_115988/m.334939 type:complete len:371 (+) Transcript_115988:703-1815(+)
MLTLTLPSTSSPLWSAARSTDKPTLDRRGSPFGTADSANSTLSNASTLSFALSASGTLASVGCSVVATPSADSARASQRLPTAGCGAPKISPRSPPLSADELRCRWSMRMSSERPELGKPLGGDKLPSETRALCTTLADPGGDAAEDMVWSFICRQAGLTITASSSSPNHVFQSALLPLTLPGPADSAAGLLLHADGPGVSASGHNLCVKTQSCNSHIRECMPVVAACMSDKRCALARFSRRASSSCVWKMASRFSPKLLCASTSDKTLSNKPRPCARESGLPISPLPRRLTRWSIKVATRTSPVSLYESISSNCACKASCSKSCCKAVSRIWLRSSSKASTCTRSSAASVSLSQNNCSNCCMNSTSFRL